MPSTSSRRGDVIRVVPLAGPTALIGAPKAAISNARLVYNNGPLIANVEVFTIFWGSGWQNSSHSGLIDQINGFFDYILSSALIDQLGEYSIPGYQIGYGQRTGTLALSQPDVSSTVDDSAIQRMLQDQIAASAIPQAGVNTLYFVYLPPGITVTQGGSASCQAFCGYHDNVSGNLFYAVMPFPDCSGCQGSLALFDAITSTSSHELCEAITDPVPGEGWYDNANGEIGDICAWQTKTVGQYTVQLEWSNSASACM